MRFSFPMAAVSMLALAGCGGGGGFSVTGYANQLANLGTDPNIASETLNATVNARNSTANYSGVINIGADDPLSPIGATAYYGSINMSIDFDNASTTDAITGSAGNFVQYFSEFASPKNGNSVSGSLTIAGNLTTATNTGAIGDGLVGTATGTIDGIDVEYDMDGDVNGLTANALFLGFDGTNAASTGGVAILVE